MRGLLLLSISVVIVYGCSNPKVSTTTATTDTGHVVVAADTQNCVLSPTAAEKIKEALSLEVLEGMGAEEIREWEAQTGICQGFCGHSFDTIYDRHCIFSIKRMAEYNGAYPTEVWTYHHFDKRTGNKLKATDLFIESKLDSIVAECNEAIAITIESDRKEVAAEDLAEFDELIQSRPPFTKENLNEFYISKYGITFVYDFEFPHVRWDLEPSGELFVLDETMRGWIKPNGPLAFLMKDEGQ
jgi:hypothetical protein